MKEALLRRVGQPAGLKALEPRRALGSGGHLPRPQRMASILSFTPSEFSAAAVGVIAFSVAHVKKLAASSAIHPRYVGCFTWSPLHHAL